MNANWNQDKMQIMSEPAMGKWLQDKFIKSHIRVGNYDSMAFVFYIYFIFSVISQCQSLSLKNWFSDI